jgi:hypothetical protein
MNRYGGNLRTFLQRRNYRVPKAYTEYTEVIVTKCGMNECPNFWMKGRLPVCRASVVPIKDESNPFQIIGVDHGYEEILSGSLRNQMRIIKINTGENFPPWCPLKEYHIGSLKSLLDTIRKETVPLEGHGDPDGVHDCWNMVFEILRESDNE